MFATLEAADENVLPQYALDLEILTLEADGEGMTEAVR